MSYITQPQKELFPANLSGIPKVNGVWESHFESLMNDKTK